jgi:hypothetical protein
MRKVVVVVRTMQRLKRSRREISKSRLSEELKFERRELEKAEGGEWTERTALVSMEDWWDEVSK